MYKSAAIFVFGEETLSRKSFLDHPKAFGRECFFKFLGMQNPLF